MKQHSKGLTIFILILSLTTLSVGGFFAYRAYQSKTSIDGGTTSENSFYSLRKNATEYQKELYKELTSKLKEDPRDDKLISELIAQNFVADFYTWTNKLRFNDVGGMQYIHKDLDWVYGQALDTFYNDMRYYKEKGKLDQTLEVTSSSASAKKDKLVLIEQEDELVTLEDGTVNTVTNDVERTIPVYRVSITWKYKDSDVLNVSEFQQKADIYVTKDEDGLYSIMEVDDGQVKETTN